MFLRIIRTQQRKDEGRKDSGNNWDGKRRAACSVAGDGEVRVDCGGD